MKQPTPLSIVFDDELITLWDAPFDEARLAEEMAKLGIDMQIERPHTRQLYNAFPGVTYCG